MNNLTMQILTLSILGLIITFLVEAGIIYLFFKKITSSKKIWLIVLLANLFTWPTIFVFGSGSSSLKLILLGLGIIIVEAGIYFAFFDKKIGRSILASLAANIASFIITTILLILIVGFVFI